MFYIEWTHLRKEKVGYDYINGKREERYEWVVVSCENSSRSYSSREEAKSAARSEKVSRNSRAFRDGKLDYKIVYIKEEGDPPELEEQYGESDESVSFTGMYINYFFIGASPLKIVIGIVLIPLIIAAIIYLGPYLLLLGLVGVIGYVLWNTLIEDIIPGIISFLKVAAVCGCVVFVVTVIASIVSMFC